jgi:riboflavin synthase
MFAGIVEALGRVVRLESRPPGLRAVIDAGSVSDEAGVGDSIAVNGCCLTVVDAHERLLEFDVGPETLSRTNLGRLQVGGSVNLESSLAVGDRLGGHFVTGHVDAIGYLDQRIDQQDWSTCSFGYPARLAPQLASKGSIAVDGVSLTLVGVEAERFSVALIPHTLKTTTLGRLGLGDPVNLETDLLAKYVHRQLSGVSPCCLSGELRGDRLLLKCSLPGGTNMANSYRGRVCNGVVVLDEDLRLPEGAAVRVELVTETTDEQLLDEHGQTLGQKLMTYAGKLKGLPSDLARNHDHYLHGTPKR